MSKFQPPSFKTVEVVMSESKARGGQPRGRPIRVRVRGWMASNIRGRSDRMFGLQVNLSFS